MYIELWLLNTNFHNHVLVLYFDGQFYCWQKPEFHRKQTTCRKSLINLMAHNGVSSIP
jgi:hypothetical protein